MTEMISVISAVGGLGADAGFQMEGLPPAGATGLPELAGSGAPATRGGVRNILMEGMSSLKLPEGLDSGRPLDAKDLVVFQMEVMSWTTTVNTMGALRKELSTAKGQLLSEGKA